MKKQMLCTLLPGCLLLGFLLGIHNGRVALWKDQDPEPWRVFPYAVSALPRETRQALKAGIPIENMEDLENFIKNYLP